MEAMVYILELL